MVTFSRAVHLPPGHYPSPTLQSPSRRCPNPPPSSLLTHNLSSQSPLTCSAPLILQKAPTMARAHGESNPQNLRRKLASCEGTLWRFVLVEATWLHAPPAGGCPTGSGSKWAGTPAQPTLLIGSPEEAGFREVAIRTRRYLPLHVDASECHWQERTWSPLQDASLPALSCATQPRGAFHLNIGKPDMAVGPSTLPP